MPLCVGVSLCTNSVFQTLFQCEVKITCRMPGVMQQMAGCKRCGSYLLKNRDLVHRPLADCALVVALVTQHGENQPGSFLGHFNV